MIRGADNGKSNTQPFDDILSHPGLPNALLMHAYPYDNKICAIIDRLYEINPMIFNEFVLKAPQTSKQLIQLLTEKNNDSAVGILKYIVETSPNTVKKIEPFIKPVLKRLPINLSIALINDSLDLKSVISEDEIGTWLNGHDVFTIGDIIKIIQFYPTIWEKDIIFRLLAKSKPSAENTYNDWIHHQQPQDFELSPENINYVSENIKRIPQLLIESESYALYAYIQFYLLSFANPKNIPADIVLKAINFAFDKDEFIAAAGIQMIIIWLFKYQYFGNPSIVYRAAGAIFDEDNSEQIGNLYKALLKTVGSRHNSAVSIIETESSLKYEPEYAESIINSAWSFPHFIPYLETIGSLVLIDMSDSISILGYIVDFIGSNQLEEGIEA